MYIYTQHGEKVTQFESAAADPKTSSEAVYEFDAGGNMTSCTVYKDLEHTNIDIKWAGTYDANGNLIKEVQEDYFQGELSATTTREYDALGRMLSSMKVVQGEKGASGEEYTYEGDLVEYKTKKLYDEGNLKLEYVHTFDAAGNITEEIETLYLGYDENGAVLGKGVTRRTYEWKSFEAED